MIIIGHRGAMGYEPENTLLSFKKAMELNVDMIELDVHVCKTGELVVIHDDKVNRTTNGRGYVAEKTLNELKKLDAGKGEKIPILKEVLDLINKQTKINIELKGKNTAKPVSDIIEKYVKEKQWDYDDFLVSSFNYNELEKFHGLNPKIRIGIIVDKKHDNSLKLAKKLNTYSIHPSIKLINKEFINKAHKVNLKVLVWTVNNSNNIKKMESLGIDGIFTNYPDKINT